VARSRDATWETDLKKKVGKTMRGPKKQMAGLRVGENGRQTGRKKTLRKIRGQGSSPKKECLNGLRDCKGGAGRPEKGDMPQGLQKKGRIGPEARELLRAPARR